MQVFMGALWVIHELFVLFAYWNLPYLKLEQDEIVVNENGGIGYQSETSSVSSTLQDQISSQFDARDTATTDTPNETVINPEETDYLLDGPRAVFEVGSAPLVIERQVSVLSTSSEAIANAEKYMGTSPGYLQYSEYSSQYHESSQQPHHRSHSNEQQQVDDQPDDTTGHVIHEPNGRHTPVVSNHHVVTSTPMQSPIRPRQRSQYGACDSVTESVDKEQTVEHIKQPEQLEVKFSRKYLKDGKILTGFIVYISDRYTWVV
jgi:hypothetical protein